MINSNNYIYETTDINHVAYLVGVRGYDINEIHRNVDDHGRNIVSFVFHDSHSMVTADLYDYLSSEVAKFNHTKNELLSLIRQGKNISKEEFLEKANG